jgi:hypothetical protein
MTTCKLQTLQVTAVVLQADCRQSTVTTVVLQQTAVSLQAVCRQFTGSLQALKLCNSSLQ